MADCWDCFTDEIHGIKGSANLCSYGEGANRPRLYKAYNQTPENLIWRGDKRITNACGNSYQREHDLLFAAIRQDQPYNETERCAKAAMVGILGRMVVESGQRIAWDEALASNVELAPGLERLTFDSPPPVVPDAQGDYPIAMPGVTKVL